MKGCANPMWARPGVMKHCGPEPCHNCKACEAWKKDLKVGKYSSAGRNSRGRTGLQMSGPGDRAGQRPWAAPMTTGCLIPLRERWVRLQNFSVSFMNDLFKSSEVETTAYQRPFKEREACCLQLVSYFFIKFLILMGTPIAQNW